ncbi:MAG: PilN domain-containing protein [Armatimonadetes bacterium]|nr:PilN domain-containing protein [Armatimonadota bacterium]
MPNINLVAARREEKRNVTTLSRQLFMGLIASGAILFGVVAWSGISAATQGAEIKRLDAELVKLEPQLEKIKQRDADIASLTPRVKTLDNARISTLQWHELLGILAQATPSTVYYTGITTGQEGETATVNLKGVAPSQNIAATLSQDLNKNGTSLFSDIVIKQTTNGSAPEDPVQKVVFEMNLYLKPVSLAESAAPTAGNARPTTGVAASASKPEGN